MLKTILSHEQLAYQMLLSEFRRATMWDSYRTVIMSSWRTLDPLIIRGNKVLKKHKTVLYYEMEMWVNYSICFRAQQRTWLSPWCPPAPVHHPLNCLYQTNPNGCKLDVNCLLVFIWGSTAYTLLYCSHFTSLEFLCVPNGIQLHGGCCRQVESWH